MFKITHPLTADERKFNNKRARFFIFTVPLLFIFNWTWSLTSDFANQQAPSSANIPSYSISAIINYLQQNWEDFFKTGLIYFVALWLFSLLIQLTLKILFAISTTNKPKLSMHFFSIPIMICIFLNSLALVPFTMIGYRIPFVSLIKFPDFITQVLLEKSFLGISVTGGITIFCLLILKGSHTITNIMQGQKLWVAIKNSWRIVNLQMIFRLTVAIVLNFITLALISFGLYALQSGLESLNILPARSIANGLLLLFNIVIYLLVAWLFWQLFTTIFLQRPSTLDFKSPAKLSQVGITFVLACACGYLSAVINDSWFPPVSVKPIVISHRGSDGSNGVPNSMPSLANTIKSAKPDYIEMDVQLTKDNKFVVMHDTSLKNLTGVDKKPADLTLKQLTTLTMKADGQTAKVPSFNEYLTYATTHHQKLLVELKTSMVADPAILKAFVHQFGTKLVANHAILHSLNKNLVKNIKQNDAKLKVGFIMPYNTETLPTDNNAFYTIEYSTLTPKLISEIHQQKRQIFAWTANDKPSMKWLSIMNVDAIITDYPSRLSKIINAQQQAATYAPALLRYILTIQQTF